VGFFFVTFHQASFGLAIFESKFLFLNIFIISKEFKVIAKKCWQELSLSKTMNSLTFRRIPFESLEHHARQRKINY